MTRTPEARIKPELLVWARASAGLEVRDAARKIGVKEERLSSWETGETNPSVAQLRKAGEVYKRPLAVFFLSEAPADFQPLTDFRRLPATAQAMWSPALRLAVRRAQFQQDAAAELYAALDEDIPDLPSPELSEDHPEEAGQLVRELLAVDLSEQSSWATPRDALRGWVTAVEELGILVLQVQGVERGEMRGFSLAAGSVPAVVLNGSDAPAGKLFTVIHELTHLLLHRSGVCDLHDRASGSPADAVELFCNAVAAAVLLPAEAFRSEPALAGHAPPTAWDDEIIEALAQKYSVSREVVVRRLWSFDLTSWTFLQAKTRAYRDEYERQRREAGSAPGGPTFFRMRVRDYGRPYIRLALEAYHRDEINAAQLSGYIEVKLNKLDKLEEELIGSGASR